MKTFYVTFGNKWMKSKNPNEGHPGGWFEVLAKDKEDAEHCIISMIGYAWDNISPEHPNISMYPYGCLRRVDSAKVAETRIAARGMIEPFNITISSGDDAAFMMSSILRMITASKEEYEQAKEVIAMLVYKLGPDEGVDKFIDISESRLGQLKIPKFVRPLFKHAMSCVKSGIDSGKIKTDFKPK